MIVAANALISFFSGNFLLSFLFFFYIGVVPRRAPILSHKFQSHSCSYHLWISLSRTQTTIYVCHVLINAPICSHSSYVKWFDFAWLQRAQQTTQFFIV